MEASLKPQRIQPSCLRLSFFFFLPSVEKKMHRSSSAPRVSSEDHPLLGNSISSKSKIARLSSDGDHLPTVNPLSVAAHKEHLRLRSAENAIHAIPLLLILCGLILWFFSE